MGEGTDGVEGCVDSSQVSSPWQDRQVIDKIQYRVHVVVKIALCLA